MSDPVPELTVFYDGQCIVCAREAAHYRQLDLARRVAWVDISRPDFDASPVGIDPTQLMTAMHARRANGEWLVGVAAFVAIWKRMPGWQYVGLARLAGWHGIRPLLDLGYRLFARYRHLLPRSGSRCPDTACAVHTMKKRNGG